MEWEIRTILRTKRERILLMTRTVHVHQIKQK
jgi:hypothetical protein